MPAINLRLILQVLGEDSADLVTSRFLWVELLRLHSLGLEFRVFLFPRKVYFPTRLDSPVYVTIYLWLSGGTKRWIPIFSQGH